MFSLEARFVRGRRSPPGAGTQRRAFPRERIGTTAHGKAHVRCNVGPRLELSPPRKCASPGILLSRMGAWTSGCLLIIRCKMDAKKRWENRCWYRFERNAFLSNAFPAIYMGRGRLPLDDPPFPHCAVSLGPTNSFLFRLSTPRKPAV